ncbi:FecCD family ABC transporter permease [Clostridium beijerinckii]|uniref:FecCD family ABC transporter permease n=1 Tax=Clostridium beijerinckii TaxID=1520 RepID=UPI00098CAF75|nr:iron ABC transporter permease [Clostridium beijerinckii]NRT79152.1 iron complex transport system permease protein [Clostridium beijerinckii]OOM50193.1 hemin transport system permease protein HmuU [Clostridium beijerinckii]
MQDILNSSYEKNLKIKKSFNLFIIALIGLLIISVILSVSFGSFKIKPSISYSVILNKVFGVSLGDTSLTNTSSTYNVIWLIRMPRVLLAIAVGAGLAVCGTVMQATVQNPLAEPYILGISSGASLGATFSLMLGIGSLSFLSINGVAFWAFLGALGASVLVLLLSSLGSKMSSTKLVLSGTVISALCNALSNFIISIASNAEGMQSVKFWTMGSLATAKWQNIGLVILFVSVSCIFFMTQGRILNLMLMGDEASVTMGLNLNLYRRMYMIITSLLTGILVANCGVIGFVGLIIPHISRALVGSDHKRLISTSMLLGSIFLVWADIFARITIPNGELSIGIITGLVGSPFFVYILLRKGFGYGDK